MISCVTAAFAPLITKRFASGAIGNMAGSGSGSGIDIATNCDKFGIECSLCTVEKCLICKSGYELITNTSANPACEREASKRAYMQIGDIMITKYNMGDHDDLPVSVAGVTVVSTNTTCNSSATNPCCWQGTTTSPCDSAVGDYSGCNRTVCDWWAADKICKSLTLGGYAWRLATTSEMSNWADNSIGLGNNGLQLCDVGSGYSSAQCGNISRCQGAYNYYCRPNNVWSGDGYNSTNAYYYELWTGGLDNGYTSRTSAYSVRCVANICSKFDVNCKNCSESTCTACMTGYKLKNGICEEVPIAQIGDLLVTKFNMGDNPDLPVSVTGVTVVPTETECTSSESNPCCWEKVNTSSCDSANGDYSGCNRTVCDWWAAKKICSNLKLGDYTWRLATLSEMSNWADNSIGLGNNGLQLCDRYSGYSSAWCAIVYSCPGGANDGCYPNNVWSSDEPTSYSHLAYRYNLGNGNWSNSWDGHSYAFSVRCVTSL